LVKELETSLDEQQISIAELVNGVYHVEVLNETGEREVRKIVKVN